MKSLAAFRCILCAKAGAGAAWKGKGPGRGPGPFCFWGRVAPLVMEKAFWDLQNGFSFGAWLRRPGGIPTSPLCPPGPPIPPSNGRGIPPDPSCPGRGTSLCFSTDRGRIGHAIWFCLGPAANRAPQRVRTLHGTLAAARIATRCSCRNGPLPTLQGQTGVQTPGEGSAAPKATVALPGTDVNPAGRAPARLAVHCSLATGGPGAAMRHAPFGRPRRPLGTFPRGESTSSARRRTKPLTRN